MNSKVSKILSIILLGSVITMVTMPVLSNHQKPNTVNYVQLNKFSPSDVLPAEAIVKTMLQDNQKRLWFGTFNMGIFMKDQDKITHLDKEFNGQDILNIFQDNLGNIFVGTNFGLFIKNGDSFELISQFKNFSIQKIIQTTNNNLFVATNKGLYQSTDGKTFNLVSNGLKNTFVITDILEDSQHNIWIGTYGHSLFMKQHDSEKYIIQPVGNNWPIHAVIEDNQKTIWVGTGKDGIYYKNTNMDKFQKSLQPIGASLTTTSHFIKDDQGNLWLGTQKGLIKKSPKDNYFNLVNPELNKFWITILFIDANNTIWAGTMHNGIWSESL